MPEEEWRKKLSEEFKIRQMVESLYLNYHTSCATTILEYREHIMKVV